LSQARKLVLRSQGFRSERATKPVGWRSLNLALEKMAALQIDAINTVIRSHYMPLYSRLGHYERALLDSKVFAPQAQRAARRTYFEYWGHECSILPVSFYSLLRWRMEDALQGVGVYKHLHALAARKGAYIKQLKQTIREQGALTCRGLSDDPRGKGMWEWSESKQVLEYLFWTGQIASAGRRGFERLYDLNERVIPDALMNTPTPSRLDAQSTLIEIAAGALGVACAVDLRDYFRLSANDAQKCIQHLLEQGRLVPVSVQNWKAEAYILPNTTIPRAVKCCTLLTPFDPVVWHRERARRLFDFNYRIEIYVPENKRQYGYYVLPFLLGDQLVARVDLKADRENSRLIVKGAWSEPGFNTLETASQLATELARLSQWLELESVVVRKRGDLAKQLSQMPPG